MSAVVYSCVQPYAVAGSHPTDWGVIDLMMLSKVRNLVYQAATGKERQVASVHSSTEASVAVALAVRSGMDELAAAAAVLEVAADARFEGAAAPEPTVITKCFNPLTQTPVRADRQTRWHLARFRPEESNPCTYPHHLPTRLGRAGPQPQVASRWRATRRVLSSRRWRYGGGATGGAQVAQAARRHDVLGHQRRCRAVGRGRHDLSAWAMAESSAPRTAARRWLLKAYRSVAQALEHAEGKAAPLVRRW